MDQLTRGIHSLDLRGNYQPGELVLRGGHAFPVLKSSNGQILIAASYYGRGKMVVASHELILPSQPVQPFIRNALEWLKPSSSSTVGFHSTMYSLYQALQGCGLKLNPNGKLEESIGVYCRDAYDDSQVAEILNFVKKGGGLLIGGQAWYWSYSNGKHNALHAYPGNKITGPAGIYFTGEVADNGVYQVCR
ncbi:TRPM8 channel-associated factor 2-like [Pantherophis guttatus]|uniref:TRPM8 channel-associated factor 2-like n=1 Tax=Pantherophis guttatus TaxID=94885 RepID=A0ABM3YZZ7_PANGU|nr:TRPM8 channel-associated factor 2-like [Pantherophis guttatus]